MQLPCAVCPSMIGQWGKGVKRLLFTVWHLCISCIIHTLFFAEKCACLMYSATDTCKVDKRNYIQKHLIRQSSEVHMDIFVRLQPNLNKLGNWRLKLLFASCTWPVAVVVVHIMFTLRVDKFCILYFCYLITKRYVVCMLINCSEVTGRVSGWKSWNSAANRFYYVICICAWWQQRWYVFA